MHAAIVLNGSPFKRKIKEEYVICADGGFRLLNGANANLIVGDFDSLDTVPQGIEVITVPAHKDFSDGELAVREAYRRGADSVAIYGAFGGRIDHIFVNISLLVLAHSLGLSATICGDDCDVFYFDSDFTLNTKKGQILSLYPTTYETVVSHADGLEYPLENLLLHLANASRSLSNVALGDKVNVKLSKGSLFVFRNI